MLLISMRWGGTMKLKWIQLPGIVGLDLNEEDHGVSNHKCNAMCLGIVDKWWTLSEMFAA